METNKQKQQSPIELSDEQLLKKYENVSDIELETKLNVLENIFNQFNSKEAAQ